MRCIAVVLFCALAFAQISPPLAPPRPSDDSKSRLEVLTDTMGVNFDPYLKVLLMRLRQQWFPLIPPEAGTKKGKVVIQFAIFGDGSLATLQVVGPSGDRELDFPAFQSIYLSSPFHPLPSEFKGPYLGLRLTYNYNLDFCNISPEFLNVPLGASRQFCMRRAWSGDSVVWTIEGKGCDGKACGTISETGLYKAPDTLPDPPLVKVTVQSKTQPTAKISATVTIVKPEEKPFSTFPPQLVDSGK